MNSIRKNSVAIIILVIVFLVGGFFAFSQPNQKNSDKSSTITNQVSENKSKTTLTVTADGQTKTYQIEKAIGKTALEVTKNETTDLQLTGEGTNAFITGINGRVASADKKEFWKLVINGKDAEVGAGSYIIKANDKLGWEIDTY